MSGPRELNDLARLVANRHPSSFNRSQDEWRKVSPRAVAGGSKAQAENVLRMALEDIDKLHALLGKRSA